MSSRPVLEHELVQSSQHPPQLGRAPSGVQGPEQTLLVLVLLPPAKHRELLLLNWPSAKPGVLFLTSAGKQAGQA